MSVQIGSMKDFYYKSNFVPLSPRKVDCENTDHKTNKSLKKMSRFSLVVKCVFPDKSKITNLTGFTLF